VLIIHAINSPVVIIINGVNFISVGNINILFVKSIIHLIVLPAMIDIVPRNIIGIIILICSLMSINELDKLGPQRTTKLNRTE